MLHLRLNTPCLVQWPWNSLTSGALLKGILMMMEGLCNASCSPVTGSHSTCITTNAGVIILIFQLTCSQLHISVYHLSKFRKWNSMFPFFNFRHWVSHSIQDTGGWGEIHAEGWGQIHSISVRGIEALLWRTVTESLGPATALFYPTRHLCCFPC